jgi:aminopeptidase N
MAKEVKEIFLKDYKKPEFGIERVDLKFRLYDTHTDVSSTLHIQKKEDCKDLRLDTQDLELLEVRLDERALCEHADYDLQEDALIIKDVPKNFVLHIKNRLYPDKNTELEGLYRSGGIFCTQCEPEGFRRITPYLDRPDVMSVFTTTIFADKKAYPILLSNGNKVNCFESFDGLHGVCWHDPHPKPSYLFALVAGDLGVVSDTFTTMQGREIALNIYVDKGNEKKCEHAMLSLKNAMAWDEQKYGRAYDLDVYNIVAVDSFNMGAMENKGLNIFNSAYVLADSDTATDSNFMGIESVIAHEYFHNWTGNRITCRDWFQLTLKEGLTVFRDQCFSADMNSAAVQRIEDVKSLRERQFVEDASPTRHPIKPKSYISMNNFYTATVYEKGAEVIRMLHTLVGEQKWKSAMDLYFHTFDGQAVTTEDFLWAVSEAAKLDLKQFALWYDQSGTPRLKVEASFSKGIYKLTLKQKIPKKLDGSEQKPMYYPLKIALFAKSGALLREEMLIVSKAVESFEFVVQEEPVVSLNRDFSAPIILEYNASNDFLMRYDTNSFTRYEAAQNFALQTLQKIMDTGEIDIEYVTAFGALLSLESDLAYKALLLELPTISTLMQQQETVECGVLYEAKERLCKHLAMQFKERLLNLYHRYHKVNDATLDAKSIGMRALKNRVLKILSALETQEIANLAYKQYKDALSMTDKVAALDVLEHTDADMARKAFADFYQKYKDNTLVMNKYFALLASSLRESVLERVKELQSDSAYDAKVPNLVRSLIGSFSRNYKHFHAKDGSGYKFVADKILEIDKINPQMASSLCLSFRSYDKMNTENKKMMKRELMRVVSTQELSKNSFEIINKILKLT